MNIGPYRLARLIDEGGQGSVYEARDQRFARKVAVKLLPVPLRKELRQKVLEESLLIAGFYHRAMVQLLDVIETRSHVVIVMEYVAGADLRSLQRSELLGTVPFVQIMIELCSGVSDLHRRGIVHRDIKPGNVLLDLDGVPRLTDFGVAVPIELDALREQRSLDLSGSYYAMSPEHARGEALDQRSDVFALGLLMYRHFAGEHPFPWQEDGPAFLERLQHEVERPLSEHRPDLPESLCQAVHDSLAKASRDRPYTASEVRQQLQDAMRDLSVGERVSLKQLVRDNARQEKGRPLMRKRPAGRFRGAESRLLSQEDWGPWGVSYKELYRGIAVSGVLLAIFVGVIQLVVYWLSKPDWHVEVAPTIVVQGEDSPPHPASDQVRQLISDAVDDVSGLRSVPRNAHDRIVSRLHCTQALCQLQITLDRGDDIYRTGYLSLLNKRPDEAWREAVDELLDEFYESFPDSRSEYGRRASQ